MAARKGHTKAGGRKKGTPNKTTASVKAALVDAFGQMGGVKSLVTWGKANPGAFYQLWTKMLPSESANDGANELLAGLLRDCIRGDVKSGAATREQTEQPGETRGGGPAELVAEPAPPDEAR